MLSCFQYPLPAERRKTTEKLPLSYLIGLDRDENKHSQRVANRAEGSIHTLVDPVWAACIKPIIRVWSCTDMTAPQQQSAVSPYLIVCMYLCLGLSFYQWAHMLIPSVQAMYEVHYVPWHSEKLEKTSKINSMKVCPDDRSPERGCDRQRGEYNSRRQTSHLGLGAAIFRCVSASCPG